MTQHASPLTWGTVRITSLSQDEQAEHQALILDEEGLAAWQQTTSFVDRFTQHGQQPQADQPGADSRETP